MQRPRLNFWLVLAATLCANAVAAFWLAGGRLGWHLPYVQNACSALALGQLSAIAIWLVFRQRHDVWSLVLPLGALLVVAKVREKLQFFSGLTVADYGLRSALQMLASIVFLWLLMRTPLWRRLSPDAPHPKWEYSMRQLMFWMTSTAVISAFIAQSTWADGLPVSMTMPIGIIAPGAVVLGVVIVAQLAIPWLLRVVGYLLVGAAVGGFLADFHPNNVLYELCIEFMLEALVIAAWVEMGGIIPCAAGTAAVRMVPGSREMFWFLLVVTLFVDALTVALAHNDPHNDHIAALFFGLMFGQLNAICIWAMFSRPGPLRRWTFPIVAIAAAAGATIFVEMGLGYLEAVALFALHLTALIVALWILRAASRRRGATNELARFSIKDLMVLMAVTAVVSVLMRNAPDLQRGWEFVVLSTINNIVITVAAICFWRLAWHWAIQLIAIVAVAAVSGWSMTLWRPDLAGDLEAMSCLQAIVVLIWLTFARLIPIDMIASDDELPGQSTFTEAT